MSIDDHDLPVIAVIQTVRQQVEGHFVERKNLNTGTRHPLHQFLFNGGAAKIVINEADLHASSTFLSPRQHDYIDATRLAPTSIKRQ